MGMGEPGVVGVNGGAPCQADGGRFHAAGKAHKVVRFDIAHGKLQVAVVKIGVDKDRVAVGRLTQICHRSVITVVNLNPVSIDNRLIQNEGQFIGRHRHMGAAANKQGDLVGREPEAFQVIEQVNNRVGLGNRAGLIVEGDADRFCLKELLPADYADGGMQRFDDRPVRIGQGITRLGFEQVDLPCRRNFNADVFMPIGRGIKSAMISLRLCVDCVCFDQISVRCCLSFAQAGADFTAAGQIFEFRPNNRSGR